MDEIIHYSLCKLKKLDCAPNVDFKMPEEMYTDFNNDIKHDKVHNKEHPSEFYDNDPQLERNELDEV